MIEPHHIALPRIAPSVEGQAASFAEARRVLRARVAAVLTGRNGVAPGHRGIVRLAVGLHAFEVLPWLQQQPHAQKMFWSSRSHEDAVAGVGVADRWDGQADASLQEHLATQLVSAGESVRYFGGLCFDAAQPVADEWRAFGNGYFILPRIEVGNSSLVCNLMLPQDRAHPEAVFAALDALVEPAPQPTHVLPVPMGRTDSPDADQWRRMINGALQAFADGALGKVVFARKTVFDFDETLDPLTLLYILQQAAPRRFHFYFQPEAGVAFLGASPERLFQREGDAISSEAVAGTRPRGTSEQDDARLLQELLESEKEQREHAYVRDTILSTLGALTQNLTIDAEASEMKLAKGRHLVSGVTGTLKPAVPSATVLQAMHPTPAVGGFPRQEALAAIAEQEPFARGWYAGPVGWIGPEAAEFAVAIRSGLVTGKQLALYSGAGIVAGSTPTGEWNEIEHKIIDFSNVLGLDLRRAK